MTADLGTRETATDQADPGAIEAVLARTAEPVAGGCSQRWLRLAARRALRELGPSVHPDELTDMAALLVAERLQLHVTDPCRTLWRQGWTA